MYVCIYLNSDEIAELINGIECCATRTFQSSRASRQSIEASLHWVLVIFWSKTIQFLFKSISFYIDSSKWTKLLQAKIVVNPEVWFFFSSVEYLVFSFLVSCFVKTVLKPYFIYFYCYLLFCCCKICVTPNRHVPRRSIQNIQWCGAAKQRPKATKNPVQTPQKRAMPRKINKFNSQKCQTLK